MWEFCGKHSATTWIKLSKSSNQLASIRAANH
jgi:hypothetical protein